MFFSKSDKNEIAKRGVLHALGALAYVLAVVCLITSMENLFGSEDPKFVPVAMLLLLVLSAAVMGLLVFGKPVMLYIDGKKREAVELVGWTIGSLAFITVCAFAVMIFLGA
ncbi:MAG TPA: hypothetical protein VL500_03200 [Candidatus Eisenbacteria bacterium]|nr:hypothetical protein [Candidatus Eisenbacteria bacterium]